MKCPQNLHAYGDYGHDQRSIAVPDTLVDMCPGDFLTSTNNGNTRKAKLISAFAWDTNLTTTQAAAKLVFEGVLLGELDADACDKEQFYLPYANYRQGTGFQRAYTIVDTSGDEAPTTWIKGQGFTFGKDPSANKLSDNTIQKTSTSGEIVFRAVADSGPTDQAMALVEFAS